ncbi:MAG TPA: glycosyltransferase family 4 protein, partial [Candidatus Acidoferrum sp.]|nr:glycosyltransferase family 4 protein [Candidatus Acidoferrum sp.]
DLLPLFDDPATFAVSRQSSYRAWKPVLLPTAPFRTLQPGERTQLMAPLGSSIVVDLQKLAALGVPDVPHPIAAWMLLFWKAAAAGWKCYSAGQETALEPQPDFPSEEAAFLLRVALEPGLRELGPQQPLLSRGNIAFSSDARPAEATGSRPRVLVVSPFLPYPLSHGGAVRIYNLCRELSARVDFALIAVRENRETVDYPKLHEVFREVRVVDIDQTTPLAGDVPEQVRQHECPSLRAAIAELCRTWRPDLVQFEYTQTAALKDAAQGIPSILVEHDITHTLYRQLAEAEPSRRSRREYRRWLEFENRWLASYDGVWTVSDRDRAQAIEGGSRAPERTFAIANGVDTERFRPSDTPAGRAEVLYVGSFRHLPNILAFERLRSEIMPRVWERCPDAVLRVVAGPRHEYFWRRFHPQSRQRALDPRIAIHDFVEDLRPLYAAASVVAVPLEVSAGTNIKVMEAMACGRAIVSTPTGCAGLELSDGRDLLVRSGTGEFAAAVCQLLEDVELRSALAVHARRTVEARFSWSAIADEAWRSYQYMMRTE